MHGPVTTELVCPLIPVIMHWLEGTHITWWCSGGIGQGGATTCTAPFKVYFRFVFP